MKCVENSLKLNKQTNNNKNNIFYQLFEQYLLACSWNRFIVDPSALSINGKCAYSGGFHPKALQHRQTIEKKL